MTLGEKLKAVRAELGLTQSDLAREAGLCLRCVYNCEKGHSKPRPGTIQRLAEVLHVSTRFLRDDNCTDPLQDIKRDSFFQNAQEEYRRKVRGGKHD